MTCFKNLNFGPSAHQALQFVSDSSAQHPEERAKALMAPSKFRTQIQNHGAKQTPESMQNPMVPCKRKAHAASKADRVQCHTESNKETRPEKRLASQTSTPVRPHIDTDASEWSHYYEELAQFVVKELPVEMSKSCGVEVGCYGELHNFPCTHIHGNSTKPMTTYKETWDIQQCQRAMETTGKYEAAGSIWWFDLSGDAVSFAGEELFRSYADPWSVAAAAALWDEASFQASAMNPALRHYNFPGVFPTACHSIHDIQHHQKLAIGSSHCSATFQNLPLLVGRPCVLAFLEAVLYCMQSSKMDDKFRLKKLFEAGSAYFFLTTGHFSCWHGCPAPPENFPSWAALPPGVGERRASCALGERSAWVPQPTREVDPMGSIPPWCWGVMHQLRIAAGEGPPPSCLFTKWENSNSNKIDKKSFISNFSKYSLDNF